MELNGKHVLVLGLGESGLAMARWCARNGAAVRVADTRAEPPRKAELLRTVPTAEFVSGALDKPLLAGIDLLALSPGLSGGLMVVIHARAQGIPVVGEIELFAQALRDSGVRDRTQVIAITGTNGKTTTTALTGHLCAAAGRTTGMAGNISPAALAALMAAQDNGMMPAIWVLELSSFQLETLKTLDAEVATVLNVSDDHLDRYVDLAEYASAKARIFTGAGAQVLNRQDWRIKRMAVAGRRRITFGLDAPGDETDFGLRQNRGEPWLAQGDRFLLPVSQLSIAGLHNAANALAALALCSAIGLDVQALLPALRAFTGLPHRVEKVAQVAGVGYYDDSKGTNVGATVAALEGLGGQNDRKIVLIAGGDGKGQDFSPLKAALTRHGRAAVLIGRDGPKIGAAIAGCSVPVLSAADMTEAVRMSAAQALPGDAVLLSPACASFDMFRDYEHRAQVFVAAVKSLVRVPA
jgi:UDP-N-acetylmuramoylalanine--D-glutamate ligase